MKVLWCWRCKMDVPMLDDEEAVIVHRLYAECMRAIKDHRERTGASLSDTPIDDLFKPLRDEYARMTGMVDCHQNAIMHHQISIYGMLCDQCGKPLRTPQAAFCAACGKVPETHSVR